MKQWSAISSNGARTQPKSWAKKAFPKVNADRVHAYRKKIKHLPRRWIKWGSDTWVFPTVSPLDTFQTGAQEKTPHPISRTLRPPPQSCLLSFQARHIGCGWLVNCLLPNTHRRMFITYAYRIYQHNFHPFNKHQNFQATSTRLQFAPTPKSTAISFGHPIKSCPSIHAAAAAFP